MTTYDLVTVKIRQKYPYSDPRLHGSGQISIIRFSNQ